MKKRITILILAISVSTFAQTGIGTTTPNANAQLEVAATNKGFLPPRVALTSTTSASPLAAHVAGMVVYNTAAINDVIPGLYVNNGAAWEKQAGATSINDLSDGKSDGKSIYLGLNSGKNYTGTGFSSVGIGQEALSTNVSGFRNVAVGYYSLNKSTASDNTAIGAQSLQNNIIGAANTAIGTLAMHGSAQGQYNTAIGASALSAPDGAVTVGNTAIGGHSLENHALGSYNVALGYLSGYNNVSGAGNVFLGNNSGSDETGSNKLYIENSNSATPLIYGDFATNLLRANGNLEVSGTVKIEGGTPGVGKVLTSDANGLASWVTPTNNNIIGEIKQTIASSMPSGWVKLDGTAISSLTGAQQTQAAILGLSGNLPNATNAYLSQNGGVLGSVSGSNSKTIAQNNLPNATLLGTTNSAGSHTHIPTGTYTKALRVTGFNTVAVIDATPNEVDLLSAGTITLNSAGAHTHTVTTSSINGGVMQQAMDITPTTLSVNTYIYLGL